MDDSQRWPHDEILHAWWVEPGRLLAGEYPGASTPGKAAEKLRLLVDAGVDSIVDLTTPDDHLESYLEALQLIAENAGRQLRHYAYPIPSNGHRGRRDPGNSGISPTSVERSDGRTLNSSSSSSSSSACPSWPPCGPRRRRQRTDLSAPSSPSPWPTAPPPSSPHSWSRRR